jgi:hypothetical protein
VPTNSSARITQLVNYHWNGRGARPASIALKGDHGYYRTFPVVGAGGSPLTNWIANVNDTLPADTYTILDSDLFTWSQNLQSGGRGFARVYGTLVAAPPPPPGHAPPPPHLAAFGFPSVNGYFVGQCFKRNRPVREWNRLQR